MPAHIVESPQLALAIAHQEDALAEHVQHQVVARAAAIPPRGTRAIHSRQKMRSFSVWYTSALRYQLEGRVRSNCAALISESPVA